MKVGNPDGKGPLTSVGPVRPRPGDAAKAEGKTLGSDPSATVELSEAAAKLMAEGGAASQFDAAKVARLAQSIGDGTYKVNAEVIADKLIANAQELLGKVSR